MKWLTRSGWLDLNFLCLDLANQIMFPPGPSFPRAKAPPATKGLATLGLTQLHALGSFDPGEYQDNCSQMPHASAEFRVNKNKVSIDTAVTLQWSDSLQLEQLTNVSKMRRPSQAKTWSQSATIYRELREIC